MLICLREGRESNKQNWKVEITIKHEFDHVCKLNKLSKDNERHGKVREEIPKGFSLTQGTVSSEGALRKGEMAFPKNEITS